MTIQWYGLHQRVRTMLALHDSLADIWITTAAGALLLTTACSYILWLCQAVGLRVMLSCMLWWQWHNMPLPHRHDQYTRLAPPEPTHALTRRRPGNECAQLLLLSLWMLALIPMFLVLYWPLLPVLLVSSCALRYRLLGVEEDPSWYWRATAASVLLVVPMAVAVGITLYYADSTLWPCVSMVAHILWATYASRTLLPRLFSLTALHTEYQLLLAVLCRTGVYLHVHVTADLSVMWANMSLLILVDLFLVGATSQPVVVVDFVWLQLICVSACTGAVYVWTSPSLPAPDFSSFMERVLAVLLHALLLLLMPDVTRSCCELCDACLPAAHNYVPLQQVEAMRLEEEETNEIELEAELVTSTSSGHQTLVAQTRVVFLNSYLAWQMIRVITAEFCLFLLLCNTVTLHHWVLWQET